ncbi:MAG: peroxide stress protein YaaA [Solirubrobacterales bacterium]
MLILLPPSEGKTAPGGATPVDLGQLAYAEQLREHREKLLDALEGLAGVSTKNAIEQLAISPGQAGEIEVDARLRTAPAGPAAEVYTGVLYDRLGLPGLPARGRSKVLIASALWGVVRPDDAIPYYRLSAKARLKGVGPIAAWWREALVTTLPDEDGQLVVDMRSGAYAAAWKPKRATLLAVRAFSEQGGKRKPVSHMAKAVRGEAARALLKARKVPRDAEAAAAIVEAAGFRVELGGGFLDVIVEP